MAMKIQVASQNVRSMPSRSFDACSGSQGMKTATAAVARNATVPMSSIVRIEPRRTVERLFTERCCRRLLGRRQLDREGRARALGGLDADRAAHAQDQLPADVQAEAGAAHAAGEVRVEPVELLEDPLLLAGWNPEPLVGHEEAHAVAELLDAQDDDAAVRRVLDRVLDEVGEHLPDLV